VPVARTINSLWNDLGREVGTRREYRADIEAGALSNGAATTCRQMRVSYGGTFVK